MINIGVNEVSMTTTFTDTEETGEVRVVVTYPDGIPRDFGKALKASTDWTLTAPVRTDSDGNIMQGAYSVLVERYDVGGSTPTSSLTEEFELSYARPKPVVTKEIDPFSPSARLVDSTDYTTAGSEWSVGTPLRIWSANNGFTKYWTGVQSVLSLLHSGLTWTGKYSYSFSYNAGFTHSNGWLSLTIESPTEEGSFVVNNPVMLEEIYALMSCLFAKMKAKECCKDASYVRMKEDYIYASSLLFNFVLGGQAGNTAQLADILNGTDCQDGILTILKRWGCYDETIAELAISSYDFCLCDTGGSGGGGTAFQQEGYSAGNGAFVVSDATDDDDRWEFSVTSGVGRFTQNLAGSKIFGGTIRGSSGISVYDANGATQSFKLVIPVPGENCNEDYATLLLANTDVFSSHPANPTPSSPYVKQYGNVEIRLEEISDGELSFSFVNIGQTLSGGWTIVFKLPY